MNIQKVKNQDCREVRSEAEKIVVVMGIKVKDAIDVIRSRITTLQKRAEDRGDANDARWGEKESERV